MVKVVCEVNGHLKGGLANQMMGMLGLLLVAQHHNASVQLPSWRTSYPHQPFATATTAAVWGNIPWPAQFPPVYTASALRVGERVTKIPVIGLYILPNYHQREWNFPGHPYKLLLYTEVLNPRPGIQALVDEFVRRFGPDYGALHARVERDMRQHLQRVDLQLLAVGLTDILDRMNNSTLAKVDILFVAVGDDLLPEDAEVLRRGVTPWGGRIVTSKNLTLPTLTYLEHSILDMAICAQSSYFVAARGSTFSSMLATYKRPALEMKLHKLFPSYYYNGNHTLPSK